MLDHSVSEHLPQYVVAELRQRGVDEQILLAQRFRQRAARAGVRHLL